MAPEQKARHMAAVAQRLSDPAAHASAVRNADAITAKLPHAALDALTAKVMSEPTVARRTMWLHLASETLARAAEGNVPCRAGCSHCCNMATIISVQEAEMIAAASGRTMATVPQAVFAQDDEIDRVKYKGVPCPLLVDNQCSVYAVRPFACRKHYSVDVDSLLCKIVPGEEIRVPHYNANGFDHLWVFAHGGPKLREPIMMADIRDFFPHET